MELLNQLLIAEELAWLSAADILELRNEMGVISLKLNALRKSLTEKSDSKH